MKQIASNPPLAAAASTAAVQQVQFATKFEIPALEGNSAASLLTWNQRVGYQVRAFDVEAELTAAKGEGLNVGADVFNGSNVETVRLRNAHVA